MAAHTPGRNVKKLYFWLLMTFRGYRWSLFSGCPNQTVRGLGSPPPQHLSHSQHLWERQTARSRPRPCYQRPCPYYQGHTHIIKTMSAHLSHAHTIKAMPTSAHARDSQQGQTYTIKATPIPSKPRPHLSTLLTMLFSKGSWPGQGHNHPIWDNNLSSLA